MKFTKLILALLISIFIFTPVFPLQASEKEQVSVLTYSSSDNDTVILSISRRGLKFEIGSDADRILFLYNADTSPSVLYLAQPGAGMAFKLTRPELQRVAAQLNTRYRTMEENMDQMLREIPRDERDNFRQTMPDFSQISIDTPPQIKFIKDKDVRWNNRAARRGHFEVNKQKRGQGILLDEPPLSIPEARQRTLQGFQKILNGWTEILRRQATTNQQNPYRETRNLLGDYHLRLAEFEEHSEKIKLVDWKTSRVKKDFFKLPEEINVQSVEAALVAP
ncbi:MAG: hypothetical protein ACLFN5_00900 [bacterium]